MNIIFFTNYFLKDSKVSPWFDESVGCLREAITMAISKGINVEAIIKVSEKDYNFFFNFFKNEKYINVQKLGTSSLNKRLPFIKDIIETNDLNKTVFKSISANDDLDYCIYANADICVSSYLFEFIRDQILFLNLQRKKKKKYSLVINRKNIINYQSKLEVQKNNYNSLEKEIEYHPGYDFFVFPKSILKSLYFENIIIGYPPIGAIFLFNLLLFSEVIIIHNWLLTWHIGDDKNWKGEINKQSQNNQAALKSIRSLLNQKKIKKIILQKIKNGFYGKTLKNLINESIKNID